MGSLMELVSRRRSPPALSPAGAPHAFLSVIPRYPVFKVPGAPSAPPRRFLPSAAQGDILRAPPPAVKGLSRLFPGKRRLMRRFRRTTWDDALLLPFVPRTHSLHKPRNGRLEAVWGISIQQIFLHLIVLRFSDMNRDNFIVIDRLQNQPPTTCIVRENARQIQL